MGLTLWEWATRAYGAAAVRGCCLDLQDRDGQSVCLLLWAAWTAADGRVIDAAVLDRAADLARAWSDHVIEPLRAARRALKTPTPGVGDGRREGLRKRVLDDELEAERTLLEALESMTPRRAGAPRDIAAALAAAARAWSGAAPERLSALAAAVARV